MRSLLGWNNYLSRSSSTSLGVCHDEAMKPPTEMTEGPDFTRFTSALKHILTILKEEILRREAEKQQSFNSYYGVPLLNDGRLAGAVCHFDANPIFIDG
jgi:hypothetical protein